MSINLKYIYKHIIIPILYGIVIAIFLTLFLEPGNFFNGIFNQIICCSILSLLFWKGNEFIVRGLNKRFSWIKDPWKLLLLNFSFTFSYSSTVIFLFYLYVWHFLMHRVGFHGFYECFKIGFFICLSITFITLLVFYNYHFFKHLKQSIIDGERLKREAIVLEYESLKSQVNPHFLFNSLNALTSLIEKSQVDAIHYVKQLSNVFRYVLDQHTQEVVPINVELKFIESYIYLQKIRFGNKLIVDIKVSDINFSVVPMSLQILLENAIKHNEISDFKQLNISIFDDSANLVIMNNIQLKDCTVDSKQIGIKTLQFQYEYLSGKKMEITNDHQQFIVKLPKLKVSK